MSKFPPDKPKPTTVMIHWYPESWGYYESHWSESRTHFHICNQYCYEAALEAEE